MTHRPRRQRDLERARRAGAVARARGAAAIEAALAEIEAGFGEAALINAFKLRVERALALGPRHPAVRARYGTRAQRACGRDLDAASVLVERWWRDERKAFAIASVFGRGNRLSLEVLRELRLILRLMRYRRMHAEFSAIVAGMCEPPSAMAAE